ncbi:hypothetical protein G6F56_006134 [Rhizopus delemar]|nr:hypothetical protein G6F56_006134 [Rhizopus delemar]
MGPPGGWSVKGTSAIVIALTTRAVSRTVLGAISAKDVVPMELRNPQEHTFMDNTPIHISNEIDTMVTEREYKCTYLPLYSPELNPIQQFWSIVKNKAKCSQFQAKSIYQQE